MTFIRTIKYPKKNNSQRVQMFFRLAKKSVQPASKQKRERANARPRI